MEDLYIALIKQVEEQGELSPYSREILWKILEEDSFAERKYVTLELNSIQKVIDCWTEGAPICTKLQQLYQRIVQLFRSDNRLLKKAVSEFYEKCDICIDKETSFYEVYLKQSIVYLRDVVEGVSAIGLKEKIQPNKVYTTLEMLCLKYGLIKLWISDNKWYMARGQNINFWVYCDDAMYGRITGEDKKKLSALYKDFETLFGVRKKNVQ